MTFPRPLAAIAVSLLLRAESPHTQTSLDDVAPAIKPETRGYNPESFHVAVNHTLLLYSILRLKIDLVVEPQNPFHIQCTLPTSPTALSLHSFHLHHLPEQPHLAND